MQTKIKALFEPKNNFFFENIRQNTTDFNFELQLHFLGLPCKVPEVGELFLSKLMNTGIWEKCVNYYVEWWLRLHAICIGFELTGAYYQPIYPSLPDWGILSTHLPLPPQLGHITNPSTPPSPTGA